MRSLRCLRLEACALLFVLCSVCSFTVFGQYVEEKCACFSFFYVSMHLFVCLRIALDLYSKIDFNRYSCFLCNNLHQHINFSYFRPARRRRRRCKRGVKYDNDLISLHFTHHRCIRARARFLSVAAAASTVFYAAAFPFSVFNLALDCFHFLPSF